METSKHTIKQIKDYVENNSGYTLLSTTYIPNKKIQLQCDMGHVYFVNFLKFKNQNQRCPFCCKTKKKTIDEIRNILSEHNIILLSSEYINKKGLLILQCNCGIIFKQNWDSLNSFIRKYPNKKIKCKNCKSNRQKFRKKATEIIQSYGYELLSEYNNSRSIIKLKCPEGHVFETKATNFIHDKKKCPICNKSKGELEISKWLDSNNITYESEKTFNECRSNKNHPLRFDFYIPNYNVCIEFNGKQHYDIITFGSKDKLKSINHHFQLIENDNIKKKYCSEHNIILEVIPYYDFKNIDKILKELFLK